MNRVEGGLACSPQCQSVAAPFTVPSDYGGRWPTAERFHRCDRVRASQGHSRRSRSRALPPHVVPGGRRVVISYELRQPPADRLEIFRSQRVMRVGNPPVVRTDG